MPFLKLKSKIDSTCSFEENGMKCSNSYKIGDEYLFDTEAKKGFCCSHESLNAKVTTPQPKQGGGVWKGGQAPLCRSPEEAMNAIKIWHESVIPLIMEQTGKLVKADSNDESKKEAYILVSRQYEEVFLGKFTPSQVSK